MKLVLCGQWTPVQVTIQFAKNALISPCDRNALISPCTCACLYATYLPNLFHEGFLLSTSFCFLFVCKCCALSNNHLTNLDYEIPAFIALDILTKLWWYDMPTITGRWCGQNVSQF